LGKAARSRLERYNALRIDRDALAYFQADGLG
jgi:uncharacterized protein (DUF4415 family)